MASSDSLKEQKRRARAGLSDEDILSRLSHNKGSNSSSQNVTLLSECKEEDCKSVALSNDVGYCTDHLFAYYRVGDIDFGSEPKDELSRSISTPIALPSKVDIAVQQDIHNESRNSSTHIDEPSMAETQHDGMIRDSPHVRITQRIYSGKYLFYLVAKLLI